MNNEHMNPTDVVNATDLEALSGAYAHLCDAWSILDYVWHRNGMPDGLTEIVNTAYEASNLLEALFRRVGVVFDDDD